MGALSFSTLGFACGHTLQLQPTHISIYVGKKWDPLYLGSCSSFISVAMTKHSTKPNFRGERAYSAYNSRLPDIMWRGNSSVGLRNLAAPHPESRERINKCTYAACLLSNSFLYFYIVRT